MNFHFSTAGNGGLACAIVAEFAAALQDRSRTTRRILRPCLPRLGDVLDGGQILPVPRGGIFLAAASPHHAVALSMRAWPDEKMMQEIDTCRVSDPAKWSVVADAIEQAVHAVQTREPTSILLPSVLVVLGAEARTRLRRDLLADEQSAGLPLATLLAVVAVSHKGKSAGGIWGGFIAAHDGLAGGADGAEERTCH